MGPGGVAFIECKLVDCEKGCGSWEIFEADSSGPKSIS